MMNKSIERFLATVEGLCPACKEKIQNAWGMEASGETQSLAIGLAPDPRTAELLQLRGEIAAQHGMSSASLKYSGQDQKFVKVRRKFAIAAKRRGYSFPEIGRALGRHHSTIVHLLKHGSK